MPTSQKKISERQLIGPRCVEWLQSGAELPALAARHIELVGTSELRPPYEMGRVRPEYGQVLACTAGWGEVWIEGKWRGCGPGMVFVNPPGQAEALRMRLAGKAAWTIRWVHAAPVFFEHLGAAAQAGKAWLEPRDVRLFAGAVDGLRLALATKPVDGAVEQWAELVFHYAHRLASRGEAEPRLAALWEAVTRAPAEEWTVERLARKAGLGREPLRLTSVAETGRTPMQQVAYLRMRHACGILRHSRQTLDQVAAACGYQNAFVFSNAFKRWIGLRPGRFRATLRGPEERGQFRPAGGRAGARPLRAAEGAAAADWAVLDLAERANQSTDAPVRGWFGAHVLGPVPGGRQELAGVPFEFVEPAVNGGLGVVMLGSARLRAAGLPDFPERVELPAAGFFTAAFFVHAAAWVTAGAEAGRYVWRYDDGGEEVRPIRAAARGGAATANAEVQDWWPYFPPILSEVTRSFGLGDTEATVRPRGWLHVFALANPEPTRRVRGLRLESRPEGGAALAVLAVTLRRLGRG